MRRRTLLGAALAVSLALTACGGGGGGNGGAGTAKAPAGSPRPGGTLVLQSPSEIVNGINPLETIDPTASSMISGVVYSKLVDVKTGPDAKTGYEIVPDLAESWEISEDGKTYTFHLRKDVRWQNIPPVNGRPFTSDDVVATFQALKKATQVHQWMIDPVTEIEAPDDHTVILRLERPYAPLLDYLAYHFMVILPREGVEGKFDLKTKAIGTGPFILESHKPEVEWVFKKNPDYFEKGKPYLDEIRRPIVTDIAAVTAALRSGRIDVGTTSDANVAKELEAKGFTVTEAPGAPVSIYLNAKRKPFDDLRVRQAFVRAVDWVGMGENIRGRYNLTSLLRPDTCSCALTKEEVLRLRPYDPEGAKRLLAEAGYPNGFSTKMMVQKVDDEDVREAQWIQDDLAKVGIKLELEIVDPATGIERRRNHDFDVAKALRGVHLPDQIWRDFEPDSLENYAEIMDDDLMYLLKQSRATLDEAKRNEIYRRMQERMETEIVQALYPIQKFDYTIANPRVQNLWPSPIYQGKRLADVWLSDS